MSTFNSITDNQSQEGNSIQAPWATSLQHVRLATPSDVPLTLRFLFVIASQYSNQNPPQRSTSNFHCHITMETPMESPSVVYIRQ
jgi:hypothetical protein